MVGNTASEDAGEPVACAHPGQTPMPSSALCFWKTLVAPVKSFDFFPLFYKEIVDIHH